MQPHQSSNPLSLLLTAAKQLDLPQLPDSVLVSILGQLGKRVAGRAACVKREWRQTVETARALGMYARLSVSAAHSVTVIISAGDVFTCGGGNVMLGHKEIRVELRPRKIAALAGMDVTGGTSAGIHTALWTAAGGLFTFGRGDFSVLGHGTLYDQPIPKQVEALSGKRVIGAATADSHGDLGHPYGTETKSHKADGPGVRNDDAIELELVPYEPVCV